MNTGKVKAYAIVSEGYAGLPMIKMDHVFLVSDRGHNWNCFGRGIETLSNPSMKGKVDCLGEIEGNIEWMAKVYASKLEDSIGSDRPEAGIYNRYSGVCQNAANRILAMGSGKLSVAKAKMNELSVLLYGKYGFDVESFVAKIEAAAEELNMMKPGSVTQDELDAVKARFAHGMTLEEELRLLTDDAPKTMSAIREKCTSEQIDSFLQVYVKVREERQAGFLRLKASGLRGDAAQRQLAATISGSAICLLEKIGLLIGDIPFHELFHGTPAELWAMIQHLR